MNDGHLPTVWNQTLEGRQYFVQLKYDFSGLELTSDPNSELVGGGYTIDLPKELEKDPSTIKDLKMYFGKEKTKEIIAFSKAIQKLELNDLKKKTHKFYEVYASELEQEESRG